MLQYGKKHEDDPECLCNSCRENPSTHGIVSQWPDCAISAIREARIYLCLRCADNLVNQILLHAVKHRTLGPSQRSKT